MTLSPIGGIHLHCRDSDFEIAPRSRHLKHAFFFIHFSFHTRELLDFGGVEFAGCENR